ncbi:MAG: hypothetical protein ACRC1V_01110 [Plesiomonas sp.]
MKQNQPDQRMALLVAAKREHDTSTFLLVGVREPNTRNLSATAGFAYKTKYTIPA